MKIFEIDKRVAAVNIETSKQLELAYKSILRGFEKLEPVKAVVSKTQPHLEVIHPETFQSVPVFPLAKNSRLVPGEKTKIFVAEGKVWLAT